MARRLCVKIRSLSRFLLQPFFHTTKVTIYQLDIDENKDLADKFNVKSTPTVKCFSAGRMTSLIALSDSKFYPVIDYKGNREVEDIIDFIDNQLYGKIKVLENPDFQPPKNSVILSSDFVKKFGEKVSKTSVQNVENEKNSNSSTRISMTRNRPISRNRSRNTSRISRNTSLSQHYLSEIEKRIKIKTEKRNLFREKLPDLFPGLKIFECKDAYMDAIHNISCDFPYRSVRIVRTNHGVFMSEEDSLENYWGGPDEKKLVDFLMRRFNLFMVQDFDEEFELVNAKSFVIQ